MASGGTGSPNGTSPPMQSATSWHSSFAPPPQRGPPPKIPLPKTPTQTQMQIRNAAVSPLSQPPSNEYFANMANYSPATPPRAPPRTNLRPPALHRVSETESIEEAHSASPLESPPALFKSNSNGSPVSPHTIVNHHANGPFSSPPSKPELDPAARKSSEANAATYAARPRMRSSLTVGDEEPAPFTGQRSDKHKRILGIESKTSTHSKRDKDKSEPKKDRPTSQRQKGYSESEVRSNSPLPTADVVPFLYQDMEVRVENVNNVVMLTLGLGRTEATIRRSTRP